MIFRTLNENVQDGECFITFFTHWSILCSQKEAMCDVSVTNSQATKNNFIKTLVMSATGPFGKNRFHAMEFIMDFSIPFLLPFLGSC